MICTIATFFLNIERVQNLRLNTSNIVAELFDVFVHNGTFTLDDKHQHFRCSSFLPFDSFVQCFAGSVNSLLRSIEVPVIDDGFTINCHTVIIRCLKHCLKKSRQCTIWSLKPAFIIKYQNSPTSQFRRLNITSIILKGAYGFKSIST